jgi:hypothetical protein
MNALGWQYRVRLLGKPIMLYNGRSFEHAAHVMDMSTSDRVLERRDADGWRTVISVENGL